MSGKLCTCNCLYAIDGHCRLERRSGENKATCPNYAYDLLA